MKVRCFNGPYAGRELEVPEDTTEWTVIRPADSSGRPVNAKYRLTVDAKGTKWLLTPPEGTPMVEDPHRPGKIGSGDARAPGDPSTAANPDEKLTHGESQ